MKRPNWPRSMNFEHLGLCAFRVVGKRKPKAGEYYASGAILAGYRAKNDLTTDYYVVVPTHQISMGKTEVQRKPVNLDYINILHPLS